MKRILTVLAMVAALAMSAMAPALAQGNAWGEQAGAYCDSTGSEGYKNRGQCVSDWVARQKAGEEIPTDEE